MCGITGIWSKTLSQPEREYYVDRVLDKQHHRGPDNRSKLSLNTLTLGHNRLSIIDLTERANQPLVSNCGRYYIVFNGEIYNYQELKSDLNYEFRTTSDTEVLLASYLQYGTDCLEKLNGMFSFAIYDRELDILFMARDRIGEKPLLYSEHETGFYFASELTALYSTGVFSDEQDIIGLTYRQLRNFRHVPEPYTQYKQIRRLEPAHAIIVKNGRIEKKWCYWSPNFDYDASITTQDVYHIIDDSIRIRERADVEIATLLSGGVDSSIVTGLMVKHGLRPNAYCLKADDEELGRAKQVAQLFDVPLNVFEYDEALQAKLYKKLVEIYGEDIYLLPLTHAARLYQQIAQNGIKVVMTGIGADEIFYGYDGANRQLLFSDIVKMLEIIPKPLLSLFTKVFSSSSELKQLFELASIHNLHRKGHLYRQEAIEKKFSGHDYNTLIDFWADKVRTNSYIDISNWIGLMTENAHSITISSDLPSMMFGIETRAPFLDHRVIEMAFNIDAHRKISKLNKHPNNKLILKQAFEDLVPNSILYAKKKGFGYSLKSPFFDAHSRKK